MPASFELAFFIGYNLPNEVNVLFPSILHVFLQPLVLLPKEVHN